MKDDFDMYKTLTSDEIDNFDEYMKMTDCEIDYSKVDITGAVDRALEEMQKAFNLK